MTVESLKSYRMNQREIDRLTDEIEGGRIFSAGRRRTNFSCPPAAASGKPERNGGKVLKNNRRSALLSKCLEVEQFIGAIRDPVTRRLFELRYLSEEKFTWRDIALQIGGNTEGSVKMRWERYLKEKAVAKGTQAGAKL